jgi:predicted phosphodiesterase
VRTLIISDIHANLTALETVLEHAGEVERVWCLGDVVGYGPSPNECIERIQNLPNGTCIIGNHDAAAIGRIDIHTFNPEARVSIEWLQSQLTEESLTFLRGLPEKESIDQATIAHGSPRQPVLEYLLDTQAATENFEHFGTDYCFVGHTHLPVIFHLKANGYISRLSIPPANKKSELKIRTIVNPGSVGQPRDRDPRASYAIFDSNQNTWDYRRVEYDIPAVQKLMNAAGLPERHVLRLEGGW